MSFLISIFGEPKIISRYLLLFNFVLSVPYVAIIRKMACKKQRKIYKKLCVL